MPAMTDDQRSAIAYVRRHPGKTCEEIAAALDVAPSHLSVTLRKLRESGRVYSVGATRGTRYWIAPKD